MSTRIRFRTLWPSPSWREFSFPFGCVHRTADGAARMHSWGYPLVHREIAVCLHGACGPCPFGCQPKTIARIDSDERSNPVIGKRTVSPAPEAPAT